MKSIQRTEFWWLQPARFLEHCRRNVRQDERVEHLPGAHKPIRSSPTYRSKQLSADEVTSDWLPWLTRQPRPEGLGLRLSNY